MWPQRDTVAVVRKLVSVAKALDTPPNHSCKVRDPPTARGHSLDLLRMTSTPQAINILAAWLHEFLACQAKLPDELPPEAPRGTVSTYNRLTALHPTHEGIHIAVASITPDELGELGGFKKPTPAMAAVMGSVKRAEAQLRVCHQHWPPHQPRSCRVRYACCWVRRQPGAPCGSWWANQTSSNALPWLRARHWRYAASTNTSLQPLAETCECSLLMPHTVAIHPPTEGDHLHCQEAHQDVAIPGCCKGVRITGMHTAHARQQLFAMT